MLHSVLDMKKNDEVLLGVFLLRVNREKFSASVWDKGNGSAIWNAWKEVLKNRIRGNCENDIRNTELHRNIIDGYSYYFLSFIWGILYL